MKSIRILGINQPLEWGTSDMPAAREHEVILRLTAASMNHRDLWIWKGQYAGIKFPIIPGSDGCGYIENQRCIINPGISWGDNPHFQGKHFKLVGLPEDGTFAEYVRIPKENLFSAATHLNDEEASTLGVAAITAFRSLFVRGQAIKSERLLICGIGGGVALFALQMALLTGCEVYVSSSTQDKVKQAIKLGAAGGVVYLEDSWDKNLLEMVPDGFDLIIDGYAGTNASKFLKLAKPGGRICFYGGTGGKMNDLSPQILFWKQLNILGSTMGSPLDFQNMVDFVNQHQLKPIIDSVYPLQDAEKAFKRLQQAEQFGKIVLKVA